MSRICLNGLIFKRKIDSLIEYFQNVCFMDKQCVELMKKFLSTFKLIDFDKDGTLIEEIYYSVKKLVENICDCFSMEAVISILMTSCSMILKYWSSFLANYEEYNLLKYLLECWYRYQQGVNLIYAMTIHIQRQIHKSMGQPMNEMCLFLFIEHFIDNDDVLLSVSIFKSIKKLKTTQSTNEINDLKQVFRLLLYMDSEKHSSTIYYRKFAFPYLKLLKWHYGEKTKTMINVVDFNLIDYLNFVKMVINDEMMIADQYSFTEPLIKMEAKLLYTELIIQYKNIIAHYDWFQTLVQSQSWNDLSFLFNIVKYDQRIFKTFTDNCQRYIMNQLSSIQMNDLQSYGAQDSYSFTNSCHQIWQNWTNLAQRILNDNDHIRNSIYKSFQSFLNSNPVFVCIISLSIHFISMDDCNLIRSQRQEWIRRSFHLLSLIQDKFAIIHFNRRLLCQRILFGLTHSIMEDVNRIDHLFKMIDCDNPFNVKLLANDYLKSFHKTTIGPKPTMDIYLLNSALWDLDWNPKDFKLPNKFFKTFHSFERFFYGKEEKKILRMNPYYGSALVIAHLNDKSWNFLMTLPQLSILLNFNKYRFCSYEILKQKTKLDDDRLMECLKLFLKYGLLINNHVGEGTNSMVFELNEQFIGVNVFDSCHNLINWIKLQYCSNEYDIKKMIEIYHMANKNNDKTVVPFETNKDEFYIIEAAIVRTLKLMGSVQDLPTLKRIISNDHVRYGKLLPSTDEFEKIVKSLEKQAYIRCLDDGRIVYQT